MQIQPIQMPVSMTQGPIVPVQNIETQSAPLVAQSSPTSFQDLLKNALSDLNDSQVNATQAMDSLATGGAENLHDVIITMEKANLTLQYAIQIRNKVLDAYQSIIQMQI